MRSKKPTHGLPLTEEEREASSKMASSSNKWRGGPRFEWVSHFGSKASNSGSRIAKPPRSAAGARPVYERPITTPRWAKKYL